MVGKPVDRIHRTLSGISQPANSLFSHARGLYKGMPSIGTPPTRSWELSEAEYRKELSRLNLIEECFTDVEYRIELQDFLDWELRVEYLNDIQYPMVQKNLASRGIQAGMVPDPEKQVIWIIVPKSLRAWFKSWYCLHELGHVAGYHPVPYDRVLDEEYEASKEPWYPPRQLAACKPPITADWSVKAADRWRERDANLRERLGLKFGRWGYTYWNRDEVFLGLRS